MLFSLCAVVSACSDENDKGTSTATLEIVEEFVDFKENGESQTIVITTNQAEWSATVESNGKGGCRHTPCLRPSRPVPGPRACIRPALRCAMLFAILIGIPLGVISATHQYSAVDNISMVGALFGVSMPNFWLGLMLIVIFAAGLGWFPSSNFETWGALVLPAVTLSANSLAMITRMTRSSMLETIRQDYIRTARAKGLKESVITIRHALRNAMIPIVTTVGLQFGFSLGGAVLVETVFSWPGIGRLLVDCIGLKDTPVVVACVLVLATMFTIINLCIDILYAFLDPRIRAQYKTAKR